MTDRQALGIRKILEGQDADVVAVTPTGSGKSMIFQSIYSAAKRGVHFVEVIVTPLKAISFIHIETFKNKVQ